MWLFLRNFLSIHNALKSILSKSKLCLGIKRSILMIKDQIRQNVVFGRLNLGEKGKNLAKSIHFVKYFKLFFLINWNREPNPEPGFSKIWEPEPNPNLNLRTQNRTGTQKIQKNRTENRTHSRVPNTVFNKLSDREIKAKTTFGLF